MDFGIAPRQNPFVAYRTCIIVELAALRLIAINSFTRSGINILSCDPQGSYFHYNTECDVQQNKMKIPIWE